MYLVILLFAIGFIGTLVISIAMDDAEDGVEIGIIIGVVLALIGAGIAGLCGVFATKEYQETEVFSLDKCIVTSLRKDVEEYYQINFRVEGNDTLYNIPSIGTFDQWDVTFIVDTTYKEHGTYDIYESSNNWVIDSEEKRNIRITTEAPITLHQTNLTERKEN